MHMPHSKQPSELERKQTDQSLRDEREKTDAELGRSRSAAEKDADDVLHRARERADAILALSRRRADENSDAAGMSILEPATLIKERKAEDATVANERAAADEVLALERAEHKLLLTSLLTAERARTDEHLHSERALADQSIDSRDEFLAIVAHDARGILLAMSLDAEMIMQQSRGALSRERLFKSAERIYESTSLLKRLVRDLVDVSSIETGHIGIYPAPVDLGSLIIDAVEAFEPLARKQGICVSRNIPTEIILVSMDRERILQVLGNLLNNALKFTPSGGRIWVRVTPLTDEVQVSVEDNGCGIPAEQQKVIFDRFWKGNSRDRRSLGLGLFISKSIVEAHRGRIWVESEAGRGSKFSFALSR
jgi:signal transduction histidine kinase